MFDPYSRDVAGLSDTSSNLIPLVPDDNTDIPVGIKAMRIWNPNDTSATIHVITKEGDQVAFTVPPVALWTEPLRILRLLENTSNGVVIHGYTDMKLPI